MWPILISIPVDISRRMLIDLQKQLTNFQIKRICYKKKNIGEQCHRNISGASQSYHKIYSKNITRSEKNVSNNGGETDKRATG